MVHLRRVRWVQSVYRAAGSGDNRRSPASRNNPITSARRFWAGAELLIRRALTSDYKVMEEKAGTIVLPAPRSLCLPFEAGMASRWRRDPNDTPWVKTHEASSESDLHRS